MQIIWSTRFKADMKRMSRSGKYSSDELFDVLERLITGKPLDIRNRDHALIGEWDGYRELHIRPNWLLLYRIRQGAVELARTGSHSELFK
jgi:mRNA interferase YafQ